MEFIIKQELLQAVADYLVTKPYQEVAGLIQALSQAKPHTKEDRDVKSAD